MNEFNNESYRALVSDLIMMLFILKGFRIEVSLQKLGNTQK